MAIKYANTKEAVEERLRALKRENPYKNYAQKSAETPVSNEEVKAVLMEALAPEKIPQKIPEKPVLTEGRSRKVLVTMYLSPKVVEFFKAAGSGYQTRISEVLEAHVSQQK